MALITYIFTIRDSTIASGDNRKTGLVPTWVFLKTLAGVAITGGSLPSISEISNGQYKFSYDPDTNGEAGGQIDATSVLTNGSDRYIDILLGVSPVSLISTGLNNISVPYPTSIASTFPQMLVQIFYRFFGKVTLDSSNNLKTYRSDGTTVVSTQAISDTGSVRTSGAAS